MNFYLNCYDQVHNILEKIYPLAYNLVFEQKFIVRSFRIVLG